MMFLEKVCKQLAQHSLILMNIFDQLKSPVLLQEFIQIIPFKEFTDISLQEGQNYYDIISQIIVILDIWTFYLRKISPSMNCFSSSFLQKAVALLTTFTFPNLISESSPFWHNSSDWNDSRLEFHDSYALAQFFLEDLYPLYLNHFNHDLSKTRGIRYTPMWVITFILQFIDYLLKSEFLHTTGLFTPNLIYYDPAVGSLSFELGWFQMALKSDYFKSSSQIRHNPSGFVQIFRLFSSFWHGHEINLAGYLIGRFILSDFLLLSLESSQIENNWNLLANPWHISFSSALSPLFVEKLSQVAHNIPSSLIIFGNPPYSVSSANRDPWITQLMQLYAVPEPNITRIYDDYVKFIRLGQYLLESSGQGILGFITNRKYLDGKIFHGMRLKLLNCFTRIYIVDLFGDQRNIKQNHKTINIFGIQTGICISFFALNPPNAQKQNKKGDSSNFGSVFYLAVEGTIEQMREILRSPIHSLPFHQIYPQSPQYLFIPLSPIPSLISLWRNSSTSIPTCFLHTSRAMLSSRDSFMISVDSQRLCENLTLLEHRQFDILKEKHRIKKKNDPLLENEKIIKSFNFSRMHQSISPINYRPFDIRQTIFYTINHRCGTSTILNQVHDINVLDRSHFDDVGSTNISFMDWLAIPENSHKIAFNFVQSIQNPPFSHVFITRGLVDSGLFGYSTSKVAPLYYNGLSNLSPHFLSRILKIVPETSHAQIYGYIYGILHSERLTTLFEPFLLHEFPKILNPFNSSFFNSISRIGLELIRYHLFCLNSNDQHKVSHQMQEFFFPHITPIQIHSYIFQPERNQIFLHSDTCQQFQIPCSTSVWGYKIGSISIIPHWLNARMLKQFERSWEISEFYSLIRLIYILSQSITLKTQLNEIIDRFLPNDN